VLGTLFDRHEDERGAPNVAIITDGLWKSRFGSDPRIVGQGITLNTARFTVIGVVPQEFGLALSNYRRGDVYVPVAQWQTQALLDRGAGLGLHGIARLKRGVTVAQAQRDMDLVAAHLAAAYPEDDHEIRARLVPLQESMVGSVKPVLLVLLGAVAFVLLIACVNTANLLLVRSSARARELAVRLAVGAGRLRIYRQILTESVLIAIAGGGLGLLLANWATPLAIKLAPSAVPRASEVHVNLQVLGFTEGISLLVGLLSGLLPARRVIGRNLETTLKESGRGFSGTRNRSQRALVIFEIAMTLVLLAGAGLEIRSLMALGEVDRGFETKGILTFSLSAPYGPKTNTPDAVRAYMKDLHQVIRRVPGVSAASFSWAAFPLSGDDEQLFWMSNEARPHTTADMHMALRYVVGPEYLQAMGTQLIRGRFFSEADTEDRPAVAVIDEVFERKYFAGRNPLGLRLHLADSPDRTVTVLGVARHVVQWGLDSDASHPLRSEIYIPIDQLPGEQLISTTGFDIDIVVRASHPAKEFSGIRQVLQGMDHANAVYGPETMEEIVARSLASWRFSMVLLGLFAGLAMLLSAIGLYGVFHMSSACGFEK
jgi:predicted permease